MTNGRPEWSLTTALSSECTLTMFNR